MVDVGDDGDVAKIHVASSKVGQWLERDLAENRDPLFRIALKTLKFEGAQAPKKEARPKDRAHLTRCGAIYSEIAKKQWVVAWIPPASERFVERSYRNWVGFAGYCRRADELEVVRV